MSLLKAGDVCAVDIEEVDSSGGDAQDGDMTDSISVMTDDDALDGKTLLSIHSPHNPWPSYHGILVCICMYVYIKTCT